LPFLADYELKHTQVISKDSIKRNAAVLAEREEGSIIANIKEIEKSCYSITVCDLFSNCFAIVECKRVA